MPIINRIAGLQEEMTAWRRDFHAHPETAFEEVRTSGIVAGKLAEWGIEVHRGLAKTGVVGVLHGQGGPGKAIGLRADMDALDMVEENDVPWRSTHPTKMHGCGHDGHTTMLLGAAKYLAETRNFDGTVYFIFQPAEENEAGGRVMVEEGLFKQFPCETVWGMHNAPDVERGKIALRAGPAMSAADMFDITVRGKGSHGAFPQNGIDTILVASHIVTALQSIVSRNTAPLDAAVVTIAKFQAGHTYNVIPEVVHLAGTARSFKPEVRDRLEANIGRICRNVAEAFGATVEYDYGRRYPALVNSEAETAFAAEVAAAVVGPDRVWGDKPATTGAEDFSYMLNERPGSYIWLGQGDADGPAKRPVHTPTYDFDDEVLPIGASYWAKLVETALPRR